MERRCNPRDTLGRITAKTETKFGVIWQIEYAYDTRGQLTDVYTDGVLSEHYEYDLNGNRLLAQTLGGTVAAAYDAQDRLETYGRYAYTYSPHGELETKTDTVT